MADEREIQQHPPAGVARGNLLLELRSYLLKKLIVHLLGEGDGVIEPAGVIGDVGLQPGDILLKFPLAERAERVEAIDRFHCLGMQFEMILQGRELPDHIDAFDLLDRRLQQLQGLVIAICNLQQVGHALHRDAIPRPNLQRPPGRGERFVIPILRFQKPAALANDPRPIALEALGLSHQIFCRLKIAIHRRHRRGKREPIGADRFRRVVGQGILALKPHRRERAPAIEHRICLVICRPRMIGMLAKGAHVQRSAQPRRAELAKNSPRQHATLGPAPLRQGRELLAKAIRRQDQPAVV
jgi:hypothetical protein